MVADRFSPKEFTKEKSLWDIYKASRAIPESAFNVRVTVFLLIALSTQVIFFGPDYEGRIEVVDEIVTNGLMASLSTLGLLLAGFTVFATISQPSLMIAMGEIENDESGLSYLKHNLFIFMRIFVYYLLFSFICLLVILFGQKGGIVDSLIESLPNSMSVRRASSSVLYVFFGTYVVFLILLLKSFVFNIHHAVMTSLRWMATNPQEESQETQSGNE